MCTQSTNMNAKEIKTHLKDAREAIRIKDFEGAAAHCKAILEKEETNYNALVFLGIASEGLDKIDDALNAYKKGTSECPDQILAWQGLSAMLDKHPKIHLLSIKERIGVYEKLQSFTTGNEGKRISYLHKLACLLLEVKDENKAYDILVELLVLEKEGDGRLSTCKTMVDLLLSAVVSQDELKCQKCRDCLHEVLESPDLTDEDINTYTRLTLFSKSTTSDKNLPPRWEDLKKMFPQAVPPLEFGLWVHLEKSIGLGNITKNTVEAVASMCEELKTLSPDNDMARTAQGFLEWHQKNYTQAKEYFNSVAKMSIPAGYYLCQAYLKQHDPINCLKVCTSGLKMCTEPDSFISGDSKCVIKDMFKLALAEAHRLLGSEEDQEKSLNILKELEGGDCSSQAVIIKTYLYLDQEMLEDAQSCIQSLSQDRVEVKMVSVIVTMAQKLYVEALGILEDILSEDPDHALATLKKGVCLWEMRNSSHIENTKQQCFTTLLKAAKLDSYNFESFLYLGHFYAHIQKDSNKALRCYRKSYDLSPANNDAGCCFVDALLDQGEQSQAVDIMKAATSKAPAGKAKWAWLRLGLYQMKHEDPSDAIMSLQSALRADPKDNHVWECLSEAYLHRGSLTAALKAFTKASELNPESAYCLYQIANIKQTLGLLPEAVKEYRLVLEKEPTYVAALKGLGESLIVLAKQHLQQCLDGLSQDNLEEAIAVLAKAASVRPDFSCVWKLMGDGCTLVSCLASDSYRVPTKLFDKSSDRQMMTDVSKEQLLQIGGRCYSQAVKMMPENASLWHNLGINLYRQCCLHYQDSTTTTSASAKELLHRARKALENCLKLDPLNWRHWNALGVLSCFKADSKLAMAQHCFIKSVECEANNVVAWSNLGALYLSQGQIGLAHDAFKVAQRLDPTYMVGWLGQALVAETVGHEEAFDLFRHTTELGSHLESELGYGHHVLSVLRDKTKQNTDIFNFCIHRMAAIPAASDALIKYTARVQTDPIAYNMLGLLLEHQNLIRPSVDAFDRALKLLDGSGSKDMENQMRMNYARTLCTLGLYKESREQFQRMESDLSLEHLLIYALAAYKEGNFIDSFKLYKTALDQLSDKDDGSLKSQIHAALAMVAFRVDDLEEAKTQLFNGFQTESPSLHGLLAMCALGLHQRDTTLVTAALDELAKRPDGNQVVDKIALVTLYKHLLEDSVAEGESFLKELIQTYPQKGRTLWTLLASFLLSRFSNRGIDVLECIRAVQNSSGTLNLSEAVIKTLAQLQAGQHHRHNHDRNALKSAQRAFHQNPGDISATASLACALRTEGVLRKRSGGDASFFKMENQFLQVLGTLSSGGNKPDLLTWYGKQMVVNHIELGDETAARQMLGILKDEESAAVFVEAVTLFLYSTSIDKWSKQESMLAVQLVCAVMADEQNELSVIETILKPMVEKPEGNQEELLSKERLLELWTNTAFRGIQKKTKPLDFSMEKTTGEKKELEYLFSEAVNMSRDEEIKSPILSILQGFQHFKTDKRDAKHHFATALDLCSGRCDKDNVKSVARQGLITFMCDSTKQSDLDLIQALLDDANSENDVSTKEFHKRLLKKK